MQNHGLNIKTHVVILTEFSIVCREKNGVDFSKFSTAYKIVQIKKVVYNSAFVFRFL